ncbi:MAG: phosphate starvation-inducible protein PhoH, partial [Bacteroidales bacterium]|nr:phosphate starvation-inducible protein PhoH [Bacteroidales bacterium]
METKIELETLNPIDFYGVGGQRLEKIRGLFPKIKIVARGNDLKIMGEEAETEKFSALIAKIKKHVLKYNTLSDSELDGLLYNNEQQAALIAGEGQTILYSLQGQPIKPRNETQQKMVEAFDKNDLIFAT